MDFINALGEPDTLEEWRISQVDLHGRSEWREYANPTTSADGHGTYPLPPPMFPVGPLMRKRPGATKPGMFPVNTWHAALHLGIYRPNPPATETEKGFIEKYWAEYPGTLIAKAMGRSDGLVYNHLARACPRRNRNQKRREKTLEEVQALWLEHIRR